MSLAYQNSASFFPYFRLAALSLLVVLLSCAAARGQAAAATAGATSVSATTASGAKSPTVSPLPTSSSQSGTTYLPASSSPPAEVRNREALEHKAGFDACKLLIRSVPSGANVWVDDAYVGKTPMLLIVPPGKYHVQLRDQRLDYAEGNVDLLPKETREFAPVLTVRYPVRATVR